MNFAYLLILAACFDAVSGEFQTVSLDRAVFQPIFDEKPGTETPGVKEAEAGKAAKQPESKVAFRRMPIDQVQARLLQWMALAKADEPTARKVGALWKDKADGFHESYDNLPDHLHGKLDYLNNIEEHKKKANFQNSHRLGQVFFKLSKKK